MGGIRHGLKRDVPHPAWPAPENVNGGRNVSLHKRLRTFFLTCSCRSGSSASHNEEAVPSHRPAELADIPALMEIREAVRENRLVTLRIRREEYVQALSVDGRARGLHRGRPG